MTDEENKEYEELKSLLYTGTLTQYGKRKLIGIIEKQSKEIEEYEKQLDLDYVDKHYVPIERYNQLEKEIEGLKEDNKKKSIVIIEYQDLYERLQDKIKAKIEELERRIDYLDKELTEAYIMREKLGTEIEIDTNEQYIYNMEQERSIRHTQKRVLQSLLEKE